MIGSKAWYRLSVLPWQRRWPESAPGVIYFSIPAHPGRDPCPQHCGSLAGNWTRTLPCLLCRKSSQKGLLRRRVLQGSGPACCAFPVSPWMAQSLLLVDTCRTPSPLGPGGGPSGFSWRVPACGGQLGGARQILGPCDVTPGCQSPPRGIPLSTPLPRALTQEGRRGST